MSLNLQQLPLMPQEEEEELVLPDNWNNFQKAQSMFMQAKTEDDYRKAEQFADDNFDTNTEAGKHQKSLLWKNGAKDANTRIFKPEKNDTNIQNNNDSGNINIEDTQNSNSNMGLNQDQLSKMSTGLNVGVQALNAVDNIMMGNKNFGAQSEAIDSAVHGVSGALMKSGNPYCVCEGTLLYTDTGYKPVEEITYNDKVLGYVNKEAQLVPVEHIFEPHYKECVQIETEAGNTLRCSLDHPIMVSRKGRARYITVDKKKQRRIRDFDFVDASTINVGDYVTEIGSIPLFGNNHVKLAYLIGMLIGDGSYGNRKVPRLYTGDKCTWDYLENNNLGELKELFIDGTRYSKEFRTYQFKGMQDVLRHYGIFGHTKKDKRLPKDLHLWDKESCANLIAGLMDTDGSVYVNKTQAKIKFYQSNLNLIKQLKQLLLKFGIHGSIRTFKPRTKYIKNKLINSKESWALEIARKDSIINFYNNITLNVDYKQESLYKAYCHALRVKARDTSYEYHNLIADKVKNIIKLGLLPVYNLQVGGSHTYVANNIVTHNCMAAGAALEVANFATKATGQTVQGFDVNINNSGYGNLGHMESKSNRDFLGALGFGGLDDSKIEQQLIDRNTQAQMALKAANISEDIKFEQEARMNSVTDIIKQNEIALAGGVDTSVLVAKKGAKIQRLKDFLKNKKDFKPVTPKNIYLKITTEQLSGDTPITIQGKEYLIVPIEEAKASDSKIIKAKNGAKLKNIEVSEQQSIIPEGTLHKNKHHLDVDGITKKGIPVITVDDDSAETLEDIKEQEDTIVQHAEIESQEVIYNKELTDYVEESLKEWEESKEDTILIEVGKRICKELLFNTEDPDNLIKQQKI